VERRADPAANRTLCARPQQPLNRAARGLCRAS
jgi:hypothetical protein